MPHLDDDITSSMSSLSDVIANQQQKIECLSSALEEALQVLLATTQQASASPSTPLALTTEQPNLLNSTHPETTFSVGAGECSEWPFTCIDFGVTSEMSFGEPQYLTFLVALWRSNREMEIMKKLSKILTFEQKNVQCRPTLMQDLQCGFNGIC